MAVRRVRREGSISEGRRGMTKVISVTNEPVWAWIMMYGLGPQQPLRDRVPMYLEVKTRKVLLIHWIWGLRERKRSGIMAIF